MCEIAEAFDFRFKGGKGSHRIYVRKGVEGMLFFQNVGGKAKHHQEKQLIKIIEKYNLVEEGNNMYKYAIEIFYSEEDNGYIAFIPELPGCSAFGETEEKALEEVKMAMELWLETAKKEGRKIPQPHGKDMPFAPHALNWLAYNMAYLAHFVSPKF